MSAHDSTASDAGSRGVGGGVMVGLLLFAAAATWLVGGSMADFPDDRDYFSVVYDKGGSALLAARAAAGARAFDAAIRCYVDANAWSIATPEDVYAALEDVPAALAPLIDAQALGKDDVPR